MDFFPSTVASSNSLAVADPPAIRERSSMVRKPASSNRIRTNPVLCRKCVSNSSNSFASSGCPMKLLCNPDRYVGRFCDRLRPAAASNCCPPTGCARSLPALARHTTTRAAHTAARINCCKFMMFSFSCSCPCSCTGLFFRLVNSALHDAQSVMRNRWRELLVRGKFLCGWLESDWRWVWLNTDAEIAAVVVNHLPYP